MSTVNLLPVDDEGAKERATVAGPSNPLMSGPGGVDYLCGSCGDVLVKGNGPAVVQRHLNPKGLAPVFRCAKCGTLNLPPGR